MTPHSCEWCAGKKSRRQFVALLHLQPNITTTRAAERLGFNRAYLSGQRILLEERGCVPRRTVDGRGQYRTERALEKAQTQGGYPIAHTMAGEVDALTEAYRPRARPTGVGYALGSMWVDERRAA